MRRRQINQFIWHMIKLLFFIGFITYWLRPFTEWFSWIFIASVIVLLWMCVAGFCSVVEYMVDGD